MGGLFAEEAIHLLQQFYVCGNPTGVYRSQLLLSLLGATACSLVIGGCTASCCCLTV